MEAPFIFVHNGTWYNPGDEVPEDAESALKSQIREREEYKKKLDKQKLEKMTVKSDFRFKKV